MNHPWERARRSQLNRPSIDKPYDSWWQGWFDSFIAFWIIQERQRATNWMSTKYFCFCTDEDHRINSTVRQRRIHSNSLVLTSNFKMHLLRSVFPLYLAVIIILSLGVIDNAGAKISCSSKDGGMDCYCSGGCARSQSECHCSGSAALAQSADVE